MEYLAFKIKQYRAIEKELTVDLTKNHLTPIIGINECGKTTILLALFSFDFSNDLFNENTRHLEDIINLFKPAEKTDPLISAEITINSNELKEILNNISSDEFPGVRSYKRKINFFPGTITITRNLNTKNYSFDADKFSDATLNNQLCRVIIEKMPRILYFDDFRDTFPPEIEIDEAQKDSPQAWLAIVERLFKKTDSAYSVFELERDDRARKTIISKVQKGLNKTLTQEWEKFKLDDKKMLEISIDYVQKKTEESGITHPAKIKFEIIEKDRNDDSHYFHVRDRSKGFFWFFNFVMKLEFNPKITGNSSVEAIYLLDEPGSYLHASAQSRLCNKLSELSGHNHVIYCTHSHYLLDPVIIPLSTIKIAEKNDSSSNIELFDIYSYRGDVKTTNAFQPIYDALEIKPFSLDIGMGNVLIVEGICDFYCLRMLGKKDIQYLPSRNAESITYFISLMLGWGIDFNALWDNDDEGKKYYKEALTKFGSTLEDRFHLLPKRGKARKTIIQDLFEGDDIVLIKNELNIPSNTNFDKTITTLFYSKDRDKIIRKVSVQTKKNFKAVLESLSFNSS
jgi:predicted ATP-dependent endonuclease of OLD family